MKIISSLVNMRVTPVKLEEGTFLNLQLNETQSVNYKVNDEDIDIVEGLINKGGFASALLYLNENCILSCGKFEDIFESESDVENYFQDCKDLLKEKTTIVEEMGRPICSINGYNLYESESGILRGNGKVKIKEDFNKASQFAYKTNVDSDLQYLSDEIDNIGEANDWLKLNAQKMMQMNKDIDTVTLYELQGNEWTSVNTIERNPVNEESTGTQVGDIAGKVDYPQSAPVNSKQNKHYDLLLSNLDESLDSFISKGFIKDSAGVYRRGNYVLVKENDKFKIVNKKLLD